ncbi:MAG: DUF5333 domain-containing protein [Planktomarina sp.]
MRTLMSLTVATFVILIAQASAARAVSNAEINDRLFEFSLAYELQKKCDAVKPRYLRAIGFRNDTYARAKQLGISSAAMDAHIENDTAKAVMQTRVNDYIRAQGLTVGQTASYCALAKQEIAQGTPSGKLLRTR